MTEELSISEFVKQQKEWLSLELQADQDSTGAASSTGDSSDQTEERTSHILGNVQAAEVFVGLYGRTVVQFTSLVWTFLRRDCPLIGSPSATKWKFVLLPPATEKNSLAESLMK